MTDYGLEPRAGGTIRAKRPWVGAGKMMAAWVLLGAVFILPATQLNAYTIYLWSLTLIYFLPAMGLNLMFGYSGQVSLAQGAFMAIGAYSLALLSPHLPLLVALPAAVLLGLLVGVLIGWPTLRVRHHYLAMVTLAVNVIIVLVINNEDWLTGGALGIANIGRPRIGPVSLDTNFAYHVFISVVAVAALAIVYWILNSQWGRAFKAIRENEMRASTLGVNVNRYKVIAFAAGSALASLGGALLAPLLGYIDPTAFNDFVSLQFLVIVVLGGRGRFEGALLGTAVVILLPELFRAVDRWAPLIYALATLLMVMYMPNGLVTVWDAAFRRVFGRLPPTLTK